MKSVFEVDYTLDEDGKSPPFADCFCHPGSYSGWRFSAEDMAHTRSKHMLWTVRFDSDCHQQPTTTMYHEVLAAMTPHFTQFIKTRIRSVFLFARSQTHATSRM